ncbi:MAG: hypothetical protein IJH32_06265 [Ruminococcus sp.]|nr:hypothetical protein [Ruminococcus sp.]
MKLSTRLISIILALLMIAGMSCIAAYAAENGGTGDNNGGDSGYIDNNGDAGSGGSDVGNGGSDTGNGGGDAGTSGGSGDSGYSGNEGDGTGDTGYNDPYYNPGYVDNGSQEDPMYWGDSGENTNQDQGSAGSVSDKTTLYDTSDIDNKDLEENQWSDIELNESKTTAAGTTDFTQMQTDTTTEDNGDWMLYVGLGLIGLAFLGIVYFIVATVQAKKRNDRRSAAERQRRENPSRDSRQPSRSSDRPASRQERGHYSDGYTAARRKTSSRSDTDEIYLPRRVK